ncbi:6-phosphogluconolactonase [Nocardia suismassiliense]|uniref:6-phosphogluconolactonase n=1 Tax=Nocardia suismassiliense TaxID=2077092 RepID=A0ABW6QSK5_9NOCA
MSLACRFFTDTEALAAEAARLIATAIRSAVDTRGECILALTGGSSPILTYRKLTELDIDWSKIHFVQTDERMTTDRNRRSATVIESAFGIDGAGPKSISAQWHPVPAGPSGEATAAYDLQLAAIRPVGVPDIAVLGLGTDGHIASISDKDLNSPSIQRVIPTMIDGEQRLSLHPDYLASIPTRVLLAIGSTKQDALASVLAHAIGAPAVPAAVVLGTDGHIFADDSARP